MKKESKSDARDLILATMKRLVPGTIDIGKCDNIEDCMENRIDPCIDIKKLCIFCRDNAKIIGGIRFIHGLDVATGKNSIIIYRYFRGFNESFFHFFQYLKLFVNPDLAFWSLIPA